MLLRKRRILEFSSQRSDSRAHIRRQARAPKVQNISTRPLPARGRSVSSGAIETNLRLRLIRGMDELGSAALFMTVVYAPFIIELRKI